MNHQRRDDMKNYTILVDEGIDRELTQTKKKYYANVSQEEMIRELIRRGLAVADKDTREQIHASLQ